MDESIDNITLNDGGKSSSRSNISRVIDSDNDNMSSSNRYSNLELLNDNAVKLPPSKKLKSIIHSFFDENEEDDERIENVSENITNKAVYIDETSSSESD